MKSDKKNLILKSSLKRMHQIWKAVKENKLDDLDDADALLAKIMKEHEDEFYNEFEFADILDDFELDFVSIANPFLHIVIHSIIEKQLRGKEPSEVYRFFNAMRNKGADRHEAIHMIATIFTHFIFQELKDKVPFDEAGYRKVLKSYRDKKPENVWTALEKGLDEFSG
ncbi:DUF1841 family protein [candidate division KSB1 bacterium]|nr:DUF1841 family protein [candidate division KSB1 bacterium]RQW09070.1 MAG: DUF1841 family protein [candidate division KSB1 bacterium]